MKKLLILALASMIGGGAFAQTTTTTLSPIKWGLKAGVNFPKYNINVDDADNLETDATTNFHVTGFIDAPIARYLSVQPGLSLQGKGAEFSDNNEQNTMWLEVPVNLVGTVPVGRANLFLGAGPYAAFGIAGENEVGDVDTDVDFGDETGDDLKGTDFGVNFMGGFRMNSGLMVGAGYGLGLTDLRPAGDGGDGKITNRVWSVSLGWSF
ncbi:MAG TPA: porin family protein [Sphingobacteriaceae bacterium]